ncbi:hypothetical protein SBA3_1560004 [Candidatus Sulfopaludibacter sp. SbA3]|nr:hypothetical protein SBA3_1560004 [Candidatus Sulfopaludibacter sp. SbA3]
MRGHTHENHISILSSDGTVAVRHINKHIDYSKCCAAIPNTENDRSLAFPTGMEVTADGRTLYVAALGSSKVGIFDTSELEQDTFVPSVTNQIPVSGGGPTGLVMDEGRHRLYVMTRFDNAISVVDISRRAETQHVTLHNPEPASVTLGRRLLYDDFTMRPTRPATAIPLAPVATSSEILMGSPGTWEIPTIPNSQTSCRTVPFRQPIPFECSRLRSLFPADEGTHGDAKPPRHDKPRTDALARRSQRLAG